LFVGYRHVWFSLATQWHADLSLFVERPASDRKQDVDFSESM
jgi:hypothetical protein